MSSFRLTAFIFYFLSLFTYGSFALPASEAGLATVQRAEPADIGAILNTLKASTDSILPQISTAAKFSATSDADIQALFGQLTTALDTAAGSLKTLATAAPSNVAKRQSNLAIALLVAGIVKDITITLDGVLIAGSHLPLIGGLLKGVDFSLNEVLKGLEILLAGVLKLVATLLVDVALLLKSLAFGLILASLGF